MTSKPKARTLGSTLLDEALAHMPPLDSDRILTNLLALKDEFLLVSICHRADQASHFDEVIQIST